MLQGELKRHELQSVNWLRVCSRSHQYFDQPIVLDGLNLTFPNLVHLEIPVNVTQSEFSGIISGFTSLQTLLVKGSNLRSVVNQPLLKKLIIRNHDEPSIIIKECPMLETLMLLFCYLSNWSFLEEISSLQHLTIQRGYDDPWGMTGKPVHNVELIDNIVKYCRNIKTLRVDGYSVTAKDLERLVYQLPKLKKVVVHNRNYDENLVTFAANLQTNKKDIEIIVTKRKLVVSFVFLTGSTNKN